MVRSSALRLVAVFVFLAAVTPLTAATYSSSQTGNWSSATTWGGAGVPGAGDTATVNGGHVVTLDTPVTVSTLTLSGGQITGANSLAVTTVFNWNSGVLSGASTMTIASGTVGGGGTLDARALTNNGSFTFSGGNYFYMQNGAALTNNGTIEFLSDGSGIYLSGSLGAMAINNAGTIKKSGGTSSSTVNLPINGQTGSQVLAQSGTLNIAAVTATGSTFDASSGATLEFNTSDARSFDATCTVSGLGTIYWAGGTNNVAASYNVTGVTKNAATTTIGTSITSSGDLVVAGGTLTLNSATTLSVANLSMQNGTLAGNAPITLTGTTQTWTGGTIGGTGLLTIPSGTTVTFNGAVYFDTRSISNAGSLNYSSNYYSYFYNGATLTNSGTVNFQGDGGFYIGSGSPSVTNSGTIEKTAGTGQAGMQISLVAQSGSQFLVQSGTVLFGNVTSTGATLSVSSGATAQFYYTTAATFDATSTISGAGTVYFTAGTNSVNASYNITGATNANGGATTIGTNNVTSVGNMTVAGGALTINNSSPPATGTITMQSGTLTLNYSSTLTIATLTMQGGTIAGTAPITLTGSSMTWTGGTIGGTGLLTIPSGTSIAINGIVYFDTRSVSSAGSLTYSSNYYSYFYNGATLTNSGTVTFQGDGGFFIGSGSPSIVNSGTITKSGGTGQGGIQVALTAQSGSQLQIQSGSMLLGNVSATGASFSVSSGATMELYYTTLASFDATSSISGAGNVIFAAGANTVSGTYNITGSTKSTSGTTTISSISSLGDLGVNGGTLTLNGASSINVPTLTMSSGTLNGTLPLSVNATTMAWSGGTIGGSGQLSIPSGATITLTGITIDARPITNAGTINLTSNGAMYMQNNAVLTNSGTIDLQSDASVYLSSGASTAIVNSGTVKKSVGTSGSTFNVPLTLQSGSQLQVLASILYIGNVTSNGGSASVSTGATLYFYYTTTSSFDAASSISGAGTVQFGAGTNTVNAAYNITGATKSSGGTTTLNTITSTGDITMSGGTLTLNGGGALSVPTLTMQGGTINGTAPIALTGTSMTWSGGTVSGSGPLSIPSLTTITINGGSPSLDGRAVSNGGTINLVSTYVLYMLNNAVLTNGGTIDFQGDSAVFLNSVAGSTAINNNGTIKKSATSTSGSTINVQLNLNSGSQFQIQAGTFYFGNITAAGATMTVASGTIAYMYYTSTATFDPASTISGAGTVQWYAGTNSVSGTYNVTGATKVASTTTIGTNVTSTGDITVASGTFTLNNATAISVPTLTMQGGTLAGTAPINITGTAQTWSGGIIGGTGALSIPNTTTTTVNGGPYIDTRAVTNAGTINLVGGSYIYMQNNGFLNNSGTIDLQGDGNLYQLGPIGTTSIVNSGTIKKSGGTSGSSISVPLTLQSGGQLLVQTSIAYLGNVTSTGGTLNISSGATAYFYYTTSATFDAASIINGGGTFQNGAGTNSIAGTITDSIFMSGATLSINSATTQSIPALTMQGGTLNGSGNLAVTGAAMTWTGGTLGGSGTLSIPAGTVVTLSGSVTLDTRTLNNAGTIAVTGSNYMYLQNNGVLNNSGTVDLQGDGNMYLPGAAGTTMVNDSGTIKKSAGTSSSFNAPLTLQSGGQFLVQSGTVYFGNVTGSGGTLNMSSGATAYLYYTTAATFDGSTTISGSGTLNNGAGTNSIAGTITSPLTMSGGTLSINSASAQSIPVLTMTGGTLNGTGNIAVTSAAMTWSGGTISGSGSFSIPSGATVTIAGGLFLDTRAFTNAGTLAFTSTNYLYMQSGASLTNSGTINFQGDNAIYLNGGASTITNNGLFTKSGGTGSSPVTVPFTNGASGTIKPVTGIIAFSNLTENGTLFFPIAGATSFGKVSTSNPLALGGTLSATTTSGYTPVNGTTFQVLTFPSSSGAFATKNLTYSGGGQFTDSYTSTAMTLTAGNANCTTVPANAVAWYRAEGDTTDSAGGNLGAISGGVTYGTGEVGQAFTFDGTSGYVTIPDAASLRPSSVTAEAWVNFSSIPAGTVTIVSKTLGTGSTDSYVIWYTGGTLNGEISDASGHMPVSAAWSPTANSWHHVAFTFDTASQTEVLYLDGNQVGTATYAGRQIGYDANAVLIGADLENGSYQSFFPGSIDEVTLYSRALTAAEIQTIYNVASAGKCFTPGTPTITGFSPSSGGAGTSVTITGTNFIGTSAVSFHGTPAASFTIDSATQITAVVPAGMTTGPISVTTTGGVATSASSFTFSCAPPPATITAPSAVCGNATNVGASVTATAGATYSWTITNGVISSGQGTSAITFNPGASGTVALGVTVTNATSCSGSGTANVTINPAPPSAITAPPSICATTSGNASVTATGGATYNWSITNGSITGGSGTNAITFSPAVSGSVSLSITVISTNGCSSSSNASVPINAAPSATITAPASVCASASGNASVPLQSGATYSWSVTNGSITSGTGTNSITFTAGASGNVAISVTVANGGCNANSNTSIPINAAPAPVITGPTTTCAGSPVTLDAGAGYTYLWSTGATTQTISVSPASTTNYSVTVTNANGCGGTTSYTVTANPLPPSAITAPPSICSTATGNASVTATGGATYNWSILNGSITGGSGTNAITFTPAAPGNVTVAITVTSAAGCSSNSSVSIPINNVPSSTITAPPAVCASTVANASVPAQSGATFNWSITNGTINAGAGTNAISFTAGASGNVTLNITVANGGCSSSSSATIPIHAVPAPSITGPSTTCAGSPITLDAGAGFTSYLWSTGATTEAITVSPTVNTTYSVSVGNGSCSATTSHPVTVTPSPSAVINAPSSVTPSSANNGASVPFTSGATYAWTITNGTITAGQGTNAISFTAGSSGSVGLGITVTGGSCSATGSATVAITIATADVALSMSASPNSVNAGSPVAFTITVSNSGPGTAMNLAVSNTISAPTATFVGTSSLGFTCGSPSGQTVNCTAPFLSPGDSATITITWNATTTDASLSMASSVTSSNDSNGGNNSAAASATVTQPPPEPQPNGNPCANPTATSLISPANGATLTSSNVHFTWTAVSGASGYRLWIAVNGAPFATAGDTTGTSMDVNISSGSVEWYVETLFTGCSSVESTHRTFNIPPKQNCGANGTAANLSPSTDVSTPSVSFAWSSVAGATGYEVWLSLNGGTATLLGTTNTTSLTHDVPPGALEWFVRANFDGCPQTESAHVQFNYNLPVQCSDSHPLAVAPLNNSQGLFSPINFSWKEAAGATSYKVWISVNDGDYSVLGTTQQSHLDDATVPSGGINWYVEALANGCPSTKSTVSHFTVIKAPTGCPALTAPLMIVPASASSGVQYTISWQPVGGATSYVVSSSNNLQFTGATLTPTTDTQFDFTDTNNTSQPLVKYFRVRALATCQPDPGPFSDASAVVILPSTTAGKQLQGSAPADQTQVISYTIPLDASLAGLSFTATPNQPWITVTPSSGVVPAGGLSLQVEADTDGLPVGTSLGGITITTSGAGASSKAHTSSSSSTTVTTVSVSLVSPSLPTSKSTPPPDALIIPAVAHANGINSTFQSDVRVTNTSAQLMKYQVTFTPTGDAGITDGKQTTIDIDPGKTIALDDVLGTWFTSLSQNTIGVLEIRPLTSQSSSTPNPSSPLAASANALSTFASSRTFNVTPNGTYGQYIPAIPFASFIGGSKDASTAAILSLQQISQSDAFRTNLGFVEGSGQPASLLVSVFDHTGAKVTDFPLQLAAGQHTQFSLGSQGVQQLSDGRVEVKVLSPTGKVTTYASVLDNQTNDPLLVSPVNLSASGNTTFVVPGVADLSNGLANWRTDMRIFNPTSQSVDTTLTFYSQNGGDPKSVTMTLAPNEVKDLDGALANTFGITNDGGAVHITTAQPANLIATARTFNQTSNGTYGQFIPAVTPSEAAGVGSRPLQLLQLEESDRYRSNVGVLEVSGKPAKIQISVVPPDGRVTGIAELDLGPNEFRQLNSMLKSFGLGSAYNQRVTVKVISGEGRVSAYASVIDQVTQDPTYVPAQ